VLPDKAPGIWIGTFHSFGLDLLRRRGTSIGLSADPQLFDRSDAIAVLEEILPTLGLKHHRNLWDPTLILRDILSGISRAKDEMVDHSRYRELAEAMAVRAVDEGQEKAAEKCLEVAQIYDRYEAEKKARGAVDFGDLIMLPALMLEADPKLAASVQLRHRHLLVDEYQDVNRASVRLVKALAGDAKRLWVVGDARQSIYRFRGASSGNMAAFKTDFPGGEDDALEVSYRSTEAIITTFSSYSERMGASAGMRPLALTTDEGPGVPTDVRTFDTLDAELAGIAGSVKELEGGGIALRDQAVLCRTNARLNEVALGLEARGIPVLHLGSLFEREEIRNLLAVLSLAVDARASGLARVAAMHRYEIPLQDVYWVLKVLKAENKTPPSGLEGLAQNGAFSKAGRAGLELLAQDLKGLKREAMSWDFITTYLLDRTDLIRRFAAQTTVSDWMRSAAVWQFLNFLRDDTPVGASFPIWRSLERIRQLVLLAEERDLRQVPAAALQMNAVRLMTIHGSKGLEFEAVHIPGMTEVSIPSSYRGQRCPPPDGMIADAGNHDSGAAAKLSHETEEDCLFFVAASRARKHLRLSLSRTQKNGKGRKASGYLARIRGTRNASSPAVISLPPGTGVGQSVRVIAPPGHAITDSALGQYKRCPRRYFYTHILGLGGGRRPTAFTQTHDCLYKLMEWLRVRQTTGMPTVEEVEAKFEDIWQADGLGDRTSAAEYRQLASRIISALVKAGGGVRFREGKPIALDLRAGRVVVEPNAIAELANGTVVLRRVRTGHRRSDEYGDTDHIEYGLYIHAGRVEFGHGSIVQAVHLTDDLVEDVELTEKVISNRVDDVNAMLASISAGEFPIDAEATKCARCPHFFVCAATASGPLTLDPPESTT
jgi:DNA helicase-2/ATP-dependent DNA helicase PcrA